MEWNATSVATSFVDAAPVNAALGVRVLVADDGRATTVLNTATPTGDRDGVASPAAVTALSHAASHAAVISAAEEAAQVHHARATVSTIDLAMLAPARGRLDASCQLSGEDVETVRAVYSGGQDAVSLTLEVSVRDASGWLVGTARVEWLIERSEVAPPAEVATGEVGAPRRGRWLAVAGR